MTTLTGFDLFDLPDEPEVETPLRALIRRVGEEPQYLSAAHLFKPEGLALLTDERVLWFRRSGEWAVYARQSSPAVAKKIFAGLIPRRKIPASVVSLHDKKLHILASDPAGRIAGSMSPEASGRAWAERVYREKLADPARLPNLGRGYSNELRAARAVQSIADRKLFVRAARSSVKRDAPLSMNDRRFWRAVLERSGELAVEASSGDDD